MEFTVILQNMFISNFETSFPMFLTKTYFFEMQTSSMSV